ncbi:MAG: hypothetical protein QOD92_3920 [Acidimicrobiaceae bacterium]|jgi:hypothetical protein
MAERLDKDLRRRVLSNEEDRVTDAETRLGLATSDAEKANAAAALQRRREGLESMKAQIHDTAERSPAAANEQMRVLLQSQEDRELSEAMIKASYLEAQAATAPVGNTLEEVMAATDRQTKARFAVEDVADIKERQQTDKVRGCAPKVIAAIGVVLATIGLVVFLNSGDDESSTTATGGAGGAFNGAAASSSGAGSTDIAKFAGHYELVEGFGDPNGPMMFATDPGAYSDVSLSRPTGGFDVDDKGTITGGTLQLKKHAASPELTCDFVFNATSVSGSVAPYGDVGAIGQIKWLGPLQTTTCMDSSYETGVQLPIGIVGNDVAICPANMAPSLKECQGPGSAIVYATFRKTG